MENIDAIKESFGRATTSGDLIGRFYEIFLNSNPALAPMFANTDMQEQKKLLRHGINLALMFAEGQTLGQKGIGRLRESHSKTKMNIDPKLYPYWLNSLIKALSELDNEFNPSIEAQWRKVLQQTIDYIADGYEKTSPQEKVA